MSYRLRHQFCLGSDRSILPLTEETFPVGKCGLSNPFFEVSVDGDGYTHIIDANLRTGFLYAQEYFSPFSRVTATER